MSKINISMKLIIACLLVVLIAALIAARTAGMINIKEVITQAPIIKTFVKAYSPEDTSLPAVSAIESENVKLRADNKLLAEKIAILESEKTSLQKQIDEIKLDLDSLTEYKNNKESAAVQANQLAVYYKEMKAEAVVKVMDNLDDDTVVLILPLLENQQVAKILALMEPHRAALITQLLLRSHTADE